MRLKENEDLIRRADEIIRERLIEPQPALDLAKELIAALLFGRARRILDLARFEVDDEGSRRRRTISNTELALRLGQRHSFATYKDPDLPVRRRLDEAWRILVEIDNPDQMREQNLETSLEKWLRQETLGLAGAICKRLWEVDNLRQWLERSLSYYLRGYRLGCKHDAGYTGINAAFVLDRLARIEEDDEQGQQQEPSQREEHTVRAPSDRVVSRRKQAHDIRADLVEVLPGLGLESADNWWFPATLTEAFFGLGDFEEAETWARRCVERTRTRDGERARIPDWQRESTVRQLAALAVALGLPEVGGVETFLDSRAGRVLKVLAGEDSVASAVVTSAWTGRVGLALSGGGFRASLFHIGVLARLAELDVLRHVEVLSCVSGGSIIGAHYYLELRRLLRDKADGAVSQDDYVEVVRNLEREFLAGVQKNLRTRVIGSFWANLRMSASTAYSRTSRLGELYEKHLFARVEDGEGQRPRWLGEDRSGISPAADQTPEGSRGLHIAPRDAREDFHPRRDNWCRKHKVPILLLNATTLNTGHNWQFSAAWMGEPPASEIDMNDRLRRKYYDEAPAGRIRLGFAVGASSCVPGLFEPAVLDKMYPERVVRLVDGGVHDNQGVSGLLEQDCDVLLVSDASGQTGTQNDPSRDIVRVPLRANSILMTRVRDAEFEDLKSRRRSGLLRGMLFLHLKQDLEPDPVNWIGCEDTKSPRAVASRDPDTSYGIRKDVQALLATMRTDLDSFSEVEAFSLMTSGYQMAGELCRKHLQDFPVKQTNPSGWRFLEMSTPMQGGPGYAELKRQLAVSSHVAFKAWHLSRPLRVSAALLALSGIAALLWGIMTWWNSRFHLVRWSLGVILGILVVALLGAMVKKQSWIRSVFRLAIVGIVLAAAGWLVACAHLIVFDRLFLRLGRAKNVTG